MKDSVTLAHGLLALCLAGGCVGTIADRSVPLAGSPTESGPGPATSNSQPPSSTALPWPAAYDGAPSALRRLSRDEIVTSIRHLTGLAIVRDDLPEDPRQGHGLIAMSGVSFIANEVGKIRLVIADLAARASPAMLGRSGCAQAQQPQRDCLAAWFARFAELALRRPLRASEGVQFPKIFDTAGASREDDTAAVEAALNAVFFSPSFLYRTEIGTPAAGSLSVRSLDAREVAARLSFLATLAPPDSDLASAAGSGRLKDAAERTRQLDRLLGSDLGKRALVAFVLEWLRANESKVKLKSAKYLTGLASDFELQVRTSAESAIAKLLAGNASPTLADVLTTQGYLDDPAVRKITQPGGSGRDATGDTAETARAGLMMHPYVLAAHTKEDGASPFPMGLFIRESLLCEAFPQPPDGAVDAARKDPPAGLSTREDLEYKTNAGAACLGCHQMFAPLGYAFLPFDPVGRWVRQDPSGKPWDLAGNVPTHQGAPLAFASPGELVQGLAGHPQARGCFAQTAIEWTFGRRLVDQDRRLVAAVNDVVQRTRGDLIAVFRTIASAPEFTQSVAAK